MPSYLGVDWANSCWVVVKAGEETLVTTEPSIFNVWHEHGNNQDIQSILVDIPIGLPPEDGGRFCDKEARKLLENRGSTVFSIPRREVVEEDDYCEARKMNGGKLGSQSWWLFPRILEVDVFLQECEEARQKVYESHPEVCFAKLSEGSLSKKTTGGGQTERLEVLEHDTDLYDRVKEEMKNEAAWHDRISKRRVDDVLDAAVLAYTAEQLDLGRRHESGGYTAFPDEKPEEDPELCIRPEILYAESS